MNRWTYLAAGLTVGVLFSAALYVTAAPPAAPGPLRVGIVNFRRLIDNYDKMKDAETELLNMQKALGEEAKKRSSEIQELSAKLAMHTPESEAYRKTDREITAKKADMETWGKIKTREMMDRERIVVRDIYLDVEKAAREFAVANRLSIVLKEDKLELNAPSARELDLRVALQKILYYAEDLDITDQLLAALNAGYRRQKPR